MYTGLCVETYGKDKILWKWQTAFLKIYMLVVLWLYFYKIMTRCQCLKSILFRGIIFSDSLLERNINRLLTEREGRTGEYWPEVVAVRTERSEVRTATTSGQYSPVRPEQARLVSGLLYGTVFVIVKCNGTLFLIIKCNFKNAL